MRIRSRHSRQLYPGVEECERKTIWLLQDTHHLLSKRQTGSSVLRSLLSTYGFRNVIRNPSREAQDTSSVGLATAADSFNRMI